MRFLNCTLFNTHFPVFEKQSLLFCGSGFGIPVILLKANQIAFFGNNECMEGYSPDLNTSENGSNYKRRGQRNSKKQHQDVLQYECWCDLEHDRELYFISLYLFYHTRLVTIGKLAHWLSKYE